MIVDKQLYFSDAQSLVGAIGTYKCDRTVRFQAPQALPPYYGQTGGPHDIAQGRPIDLLVKVVEAVDSAGGAGTVQARLVMADDEDLSVNRAILQTSEAIAEAVLVAGYEFRLGGTLPPGTTKLFVGVEYLTAGEALTAGKVTATLPFGRDSAAFV